MNPLVSIIIPTYNRAHLISETLNSLLAQTYTNWECIIVDDGSREVEFNFIKKIIANDERIKLLKRLDFLSKGPSACRNLGLKHAAGEYIQFFDDDDLMYPEMLTLKVNAIIKENNDVVVAPLDYYDVSTKKIIKQNQVYSVNVISDYVLANISWYVSGPLWKKKFLAVEFDSAIQTLDDWDFNLRNIYRKPKILFLNESLQRYNKYTLVETLSTLGQLGDEKQIMSAFLVYKKHYQLLKNQNLLSNDLHRYLIERLVFLLRASLEAKQELSKDIYKFLRKNLHLTDIYKFSNIVIGYYSFRLFGMGYRFMKFNK